MPFKVEFRCLWTVAFAREELRVAMILTGCSDVNRAAPDLLLKD